MTNNCYKELVIYFITIVLCSLPEIFLILGDIGEEQTFLHPQGSSDWSNN